MSQLINYEFLKLKYDNYDKYESYLNKKFYKHYYNFIELYFTNRKK